MAFAKIDACIVCEGFRPELHNKNLLFGFFGITPYVRVRLKDVHAPVALCFVFSGGSPISPGSFNLRLRLIDPTGREVTGPQNSPAISPASMVAAKGPTNIFLSFSGVLGSVGTFRVGLIADQVEQYGTTIEIEQIPKTQA
ncbi:MAG: hypothetical protein WAM79_13580 [Candidatus Sulfotelmatobacter sp.]